MVLVSVIIPTFNRFEYLLNAVRSVLNQTHNDIEVIIVNDCSTDKSYYEFDFTKEFGNNVFIVHLPRNSRSICNNSCQSVAGGGNSRNIGMMLAKGEFIAFLDDDDCFLPTKIEKQLVNMLQLNCKMSCTEAYVGSNFYDQSKTYCTQHFLGKHWGFLLNKFRSISSEAERSFLSMYKDNINVWSAKDLEHHNCIVASSVMISKDVVNMIGYFPIKSFGEDYEYWKMILKDNKTKCVFLREPLTYIDEGSVKHY